MRKSELREQTEFSMFVHIPDHWQRASDIWKMFANEQVRAVGAASDFIKWYCGDEDTECPYTSKEIRKIADDLFAVADNSCAGELKRYREDYSMLMRFGTCNFMGGLVFSEIIKLLDYMADLLDQRISGEQTEKVIDAAEAVLDKYEGFYAREGA